MVAPFARTAGQFFGGRRADRVPSAVALTSSLVISWLFAKSITNAANLSLAFGLLGGVAYGAYYFSFIVAGWVIYRMRAVGGYRSIHHFLQSKFGRGAMVLFTVLICIRLFNEVWSNTMVIGSYFGEVGELGYYLAIGVFTVSTLAYSLKGGMSSSIMTDIIQLLLFGALLGVILTVLLPRFEGGALGDMVREPWSMAMGGNLLVVALLQSFSYPFHDPVLTDRGFLSDPKATLRAFLWAAPLGFLAIVLFSIAGLYGRGVGVTGQAPVEVAKLLGGPVLLVMNFIMITSAASTLDSTITSFSKLAAVDLRLGLKGTALTQVQGKGEEGQVGEGGLRDESLYWGRLAMLLIVVLGTIPIFLSPAILSATTVSGVMVFGLAPVFCLWRADAGALSFYLSVGFGLVCGLVFALGWWPQSWLISSGKYADLLSVSLVELAGCFLLFYLPIHCAPASAPKKL